MGNQVPDIFLTYEHELYFAGETLTGQASFRVPVGAVVDFSSIKLTFTGGEYTIVHYTRDIGSGEKRRTIKRIAYGKRNLYYNELPVIPSQITGREHAAGQGQGYVFGDITIPFSIDLPHGLPSTMELGKEKNTCSIKYTLAVEVHGVAIANKAVNIVQMPRMLPIQPTIIDPEIQAIRCCCFAVDCGAIALGASLQQPCIAIGSESCPYTHYTHYTHYIHYIHYTHYTHYIHYTHYTHYTIHTIHTIHTILYTLHTPYCDRFGGMPPSLHYHE